MKILLNKNDLNEALNRVSDLGFVPTMGSLHKGHISLIKRSKKSGLKTLVSIYINPKQFNKKSDFRSYPRNTKKDIKLLKRYVSENGKILPSRITNVSQKKQRELSVSIKRARNLALI